MGHRKNRKRQRRGEGWDELTLKGMERWEPSAPSDSDFLVLLGLRDLEDQSAGDRHCGGCREFIEDQEGGRGTCLHPGSGVLSPWTDTGSCAFFQARHGARAGLRRG